MAPNVRISDQELDALSKRITNVNEGIQAEVRNLERLPAALTSGVECVDLLDCGCHLISLSSSTTS